MQTVIKKRRIKKSFVSILLALALLTVVLPTTAFANSNFWQGGTAFQYESVGAPFYTGSDNKLTVVAIGSVAYGNPGYVTIKLQKNVLGAYITQKTIQIPANGSSNTIFRDYPVSTNTNYRFAYSCGGTSGIDAANISMGISLWH